MRQSNRKGCVDAAHKNSSKALSVTLVRTVLASLASCLALVVIYQSSASCKSDWVEGDATEFQQEPASSDTSSSKDGEQLKPNPASLKGNVSHWSQNEINNFLLGPSHNYFPTNVIPAKRGLPPAHILHVNPTDFQKWLKLSNASFIEELPGVGKKAIVEIKGKWDNAGHVLHTLGMPSTQINAKDLTEKFLEQTKVLIINCGARLSNENQSLVRNFVRQGGMLLSTDWALNDCISPCFPGYVKWSGEFSTAGVLNDARISTRDFRFMKGVVSPSYWKLEDKSQLVEVLRDDVEVLVTSKILAYDSAGSGILAFSFPYEKGQVLHLVGHFDNNSDFASANILPDPSPEIMISLRQAIATNFITSAFVCERH